MTTRRLVRPLAYLRIRHDDKLRYDYVYPGIAAVLLTLLVYVIPGEPRILGPEGLVSIFVGLLQILTGFYIASLAAVATFGQQSMDKVMAGTPPTLVDMRRGQPIDRQLTRREFLSLMFGYLALLSITLYVVGALANLVLPDLLPVIADLLPEWLVVIAPIAGVLIYLFAVSNLMVTTLLGLFYMADRIHR